MSRRPEFEAAYYTRDQPPARSQVILQFLETMESCRVVHRDGGSRFTYQCDKTLRSSSGSPAPFAARGVSPSRVGDLVRAPIFTPRVIAGPAEFGYGWSVQARI
jgi:hypothetical protein